MAWVYIAQVPGGPVKIGYSRSPEERVERLRPAVLIGKISFDSSRAALTFERRLQVECAASAIDGAGEWFHPTASVAAVVYKHFGASVAACGPVQLNSEPATAALRRRFARQKSSQPDDSVGGRIRALRFALGMTQDDLAANAGVTRTNVCAAENGRSKLSRGSVRGRLAAGFGVAFCQFEAYVNGRVGLDDIVAACGAGDH